MCSSAGDIPRFTCYKGIQFDVCVLEAEVLKEEKLWTLWAKYVVLGFSDRKLDYTENHKVQFAHNGSLIMMRAIQLYFIEPCAAIRTIHMAYVQTCYVYFGTIRLLVGKTQEPRIQ